MYFQFTGTAIRGNHLAGNFINHHKSWVFDAAFTRHHGGRRNADQRDQTATPSATSKAMLESTCAAAHQSTTVTAEAQVPDQAGYSRCRRM